MISYTFLGIFYVISRLWKEQNILCTCKDEDFQPESNICTLHRILAVTTVNLLTLKALVVTIDAQWRGWGM